MNWCFNYSDTIDFGKINNIYNNIYYNIYYKYEMLYLWNSKRVW